VIDNLRSAWRSLRAAPGFSAFVVATVALGVGANTAVLSVADAVLFRPLPFDNPERVFVLLNRDRETGRRSTAVSYEWLRILDSHHSSLSDAAAAEPSRTVVVPGADGPQAIRVAAVTPNYFEVLGVRPARGRVFQDADLQSGTPAMLSYAAWQQRFAGRSTIVGESITLGSWQIDVIGVLPHDFVFPSLLIDRPEVITLAEPLARRSGNAFYPAVRLDPDVSVAQAQAEIDSLLAGATANTRGAAATLSLDDVPTTMFTAGRPIMWLALTAALLVFLVGCSNLVTLALARTRRREREIAVCLALGAGTRRLVSVLMLEGAMLGLAGATLAVAVARATFEVLLPHVPPIAYRTAVVGVDVRVAIAGLTLGLVAGMLFVVGPAWRLARLDIQTVLQRNSGAASGRQLIARPLLVLQVALAIVLVFGTTVAARAFLAVLGIDLGVVPEHVLTLRVAPPSGTLGVGAQAFYLRAIDTLAEQPYVVTAGAASTIPLDGSAADSAVRTSDGRTIASVAFALPGFFESAGIRLVRGRLLQRSDITTGQAAIVTESAAQSMFGDAEPLGQSFTSVSGRRHTVVGIVTNHVSSLTRQGPPLVYVLPGESTRGMTVLVRTRSRSESVLRDLTRISGVVAPHAPTTAAWWSDSIGASTPFRNPRFQTLVLGFFATLAVVLTAFGIYAVVAFLVVARTREWGVRLAIGAAPQTLTRLIIRQTVVPVFAGVVVGVFATRGLARLAEAQLFQVRTDDPGVLMIAVIVVCGASWIAAALPARRVTRVDPVTALRADG
jgi:predicted permease